MPEIDLTSNSNGHVHLEEALDELPLVPASDDPETQTTDRVAEDAPELLDDPTLFAYLALGALLTVTTGVLAGTPNLLAISNAVVPFAVFALAVRRGRLARATQFVVFWFVWQAIASMALSLVLPARAEAVFPGSFEQRISLIQWVSNGGGDLGNSAIYLPQQGVDLLGWALGCFLTGGAASLYELVLRVNAYGFAVAGLFPDTHSLLRSVLVAILGWTPWTLLRVVGLATLGAALAEPLLRWDLRSLAYRRRPLVLGLGLVVLGSLLQLLLSGTWAGLLRALTST